MPEGKQTVLRFVLKTTEDPMAVLSRFRPHGKVVLNRTAWRGKEPRSCAVTALRSRPHQAGGVSPVVFDLEVSYRPPGVITYVGGTRYDGWTAVVLDRGRDGTLLDGKGNPLPEGQPPVYLRFEAYEDVEFNEIEFGEFVGEGEAEGVRHISVEAAMGQLRSELGIRASLDSGFVAPRRHRPLVKIVISGEPSGVGADGFGTRVVNVNKMTPHLERVLLDELTELLSGFVEGRYSVKNFTDGERVFAILDDVLVDYTPAEQGGEPQFDCLGLFLPDSFLEDLAKRLIATYQVDVDVVEGPKGGLLLRRAGGPEQR